MLSATAIIRMIDDAYKKLGIEYIEFAKKSGVPVERWRALRKGERRMTVDDLPKLAKAAGLSFQVVAPYHDRFMDLTQEEAESLLKLSEHYKKNGPKQPHILRSAVEKLTGP